MTDLHRLTLAELNEGLRARRFSSVELARHFLARIERFNPALNAFITVTGEQALAAAQKADQVIAAGEAPPLAGLPIVHKDIFCTDGVLTTCGSRMLSNFVAPYDATVVERLSQAGVVMLGGDRFGRSLVATGIDIVVSIVRGRVGRRHRRLRLLAAIEEASEWHGRETTSASCN